MRRRGSIQDVAMLGIILLFFGIVVLIGFKITSLLNTQFQATDLLPDTAKTASQSLTETYTGAVDSSFLFLTVGIGIAALALAALVRVHPIFIPFFIIALIFVVFFSAVFSNIYQGMAEDAAMAAEAAQLTFITHILTYLPFIVGVLGTVLMIVMYKSWQGAEG